MQGADRRREEDQMNNAIQSDAVLGIGPRRLQPGEILQFRQAVHDTHERMGASIKRAPEPVHPKARRDARMARLRSLAIGRGEYKELTK